MNVTKRTWQEAWREFRAPLDPLSSREQTIILVTSILVAVTLLWARSKSVWDWDEMLFADALNDYNVSHHHPHPPGFPLFIAFGKLAHLFLHDNFRAMQGVVMVAACLFFPALFLLARELRFRFDSA